jgi:hypothetical protein
MWIEDSGYLPRTTSYKGGRRKKTLTLFLVALTSKRQSGWASAPITYSYLDRVDGVARAPGVSKLSSQANNGTFSA